MKKNFVLFTFLFIAGCIDGHGQADTLAPYKKDNNLPAFNILLPDSTYFTPQQLPKYQYTAIIYFSPDCGHCQYTAKELVKSIDSLKNVFFVMAAFKSLEDIKGFTGYYGLDKYPNIRVGRDPLYFIPSFYRVEATPYVALYDRNHKLIRVFDPPHHPVMEVSELVSIVNKN